MTQSRDTIPVYLEIGSKRTFAGALDWPGWCRGGRDEASALEALLGYGARYARALRYARLGFRAPGNVSAFSVTERMEGNATTDFGAPAAPPSTDLRSLDETEVRRLGTILKACWRTFDKAMESAEGRELRKGPRGGGRDLRRLIEHVLDADGAYLGRLGWRLQIAEEADPAEQLRQARRTILEAFAATAYRESPGTGPRGGVRWMPAYFVRRVAWHTLDHAWEIEDRLS